MLCSTKAVFNPIRFRKIKNCPYHPTRNDCTFYVLNDNEIHATLIEIQNSKNFNDKLYLQSFVDIFDIIRSRDKLWVSVVLDKKMRWLTIDKSGETNHNILTAIRQYLTDYLQKVTVDAKKILLMKNKTCVDLLYNEENVVVLPQNIMLFEEEKYQTIFHKYGFQSNYDVWLNQKLYVTYLICNTLLTLTLKVKNPLESATTTFSKFKKNIPKCKLNPKTHLGLCNFEFADATLSENHVFCIPVNFLKRLCVYQKWIQSPNRISSHVTALVNKRVKNVVIPITDDEFVIFINYLQNILRYF